MVSSNNKMMVEILDESVEFRTTKEEKKIFLENMRANNFRTLSSYFRWLGKLHIRISSTVDMPTVLRVSDAQLRSETHHGEEEKRVAG